MNKEDWNKELSEEISFWKIWFETKGLSVPSDLVNRLDPDFEIDQEYKLLFGDRLPSFSILDAGCGPLSILGKKYNGIKLNITCADLLADEYNKMMHEMNIKPLIQPVAVDFENLAEYFGKEKFDFIHCVNCIDHSFNPIKSISGLLDVLKKDGLLYIRHLKNEADHGNFHGLHKWNFYIKDGIFFISGIDKSVININELFSDTAIIKNIERKVNDKNLVISHFIKK